MVDLACSVRGCGLALERGERSLHCTRGHAFDRARSGYVNLLQPQDRRSLDAGDSRSAVEARRRLFEAGFFAPLQEGLEQALAVRGLPAGARVLDIGCGEGSNLARLARHFALDAVGLDLSAHAVDLAARAFPEVTWIVANGDRRLPFADGALDVVLSVTARRAPDEFARVLGPGGLVLVAVPGSDDLAELRAVVLGDARELGAVQPVAEEFAARFSLVDEAVVRARRRTATDELADLCASTYRLGRPGRAERIAALEPMELTASWQLSSFRRRPGSGIEDERARRAP